MPDTRTRAQRNRAIRQEELRDRLAAGGHLDHVIDMAGKLADVDTPLEPDKVNRLKLAIDAKMKLVDKYLPSLKAVELTGDKDNPVAVTHIEIVAPSVKSED